MTYCPRPACKVTRDDGDSHGSTVAVLGPSTDLPRPCLKSKCAVRDQILLKCRGPARPGEVVSRKMGWGFRSVMVSRRDEDFGPRLAIADRLGAASSPRAIERLWTSYDGTKDHSFQIWTLLSSSSVYRFIDSEYHAKTLRGHTAAGWAPGCIAYQNQNKHPLPVRSAEIIPYQT